MTDSELHDNGHQGDAAIKSAPTAVAVLEYLVRNVVDDADGVKVDVESVSETRLALNVQVSPGDMGRVIGRRGRVANAIRTLVRAAAVRDNVEVDIEFVD